MENRAHLMSGIFRRALGYTDIVQKLGLQHIP